ncbi:MAG: DegQ family serine endoprotease [Verrucomicrobia bacterium]|nr:DegQ family serine endoprotease [Verrucomicrobiota bacterium]
MKQRIAQFTRHLRIGLLAGSLVVAGATMAFTSRDNGNQARITPVRLVVDDSSPERNGQFTTSFAPVVKKVAPSVVQVNVSSKARIAEHPDLPFNDPLFRRFFGDQFHGQQRRGTQQAPRRGQGSGVVVTKEGYILTNNHVVDGADEVTVVLHDRREFNARVIGKDPKTDIAVLKIEADNLPYLPLANSDKIEIGDIVLAVGNPFGIGQTVTMGIISATGRGNMGIDYEDFIQTDAAINPGNSGGALVDAQGRLIGINTAILSRSGGNQGIGFSVPVNLARNVMESLVQDGRVVRGYVGIAIQDLNPALAEQFNVKQTSGALISEVKENAPAAKAGLQIGDVVVQWNGADIRDSRQLKLQVAQTRPNQKATVKVMRDGKAKTVSITPKELPGSEVASKSSSREDSSANTLRGVEVGDIDIAARSHLRLPANMKGALVTVVDGDSAAFAAGLRDNDVILEINRKAVKSAAEAIDLGKTVKTSKVLLRVWSNGGTRYIAVDESNTADKLG